MKRTRPDPSKAFWSDSALGVVALLCWVGLGMAEEFHGVSPYWGPEMRITDAESNASGGVGRMLAVDGSGVLHVVYHTPDDFSVFYTRSENGGGSWATPSQLSTGTLIAHGPNIAVGPENRLHVAWVNGVDGEPTHIYYRRFVPGDGWDPDPRDISGTMPFDAQTPSISVDLQGRVHVAWHIGEEPVAPKVYYTRSTNGGDSFATPEQISGSGPDMHAAWPRFSVQGTTGDIVAIPWRDLRLPDDSDGNVYVAVSDDGGLTFTEHDVPTFEGANELDPTAIVDGDGVIHLAYTQESEGSIGMATYQRSADLGASWSDEVTMTDEPSRFSFWSYHAGNDVLWLLWKDERDGVPGDEKSDLMVTHSADGGLTWEPREFVTDLGDIDVRFPTIAVDPAGQPYAIWSDLRAGETMSAMFLKHRDPAGAGAEEDVLPVGGLALHPAVPNPLGGRTAIRYELPEPADVRIDVYDVSGRLVRTLVDAPGQSAGAFEITWDGCDGRGRRLASGTYLYRLVAGNSLQTRKLVLRR